MNSQPRPPDIRSGLTLNTDDVIRIMTGTGAGWGDPLKRGIELIKEDIKNQYITLEQANRDYDFANRIKQER